MAHSTKERDGVRKVSGKHGVRWQAKASIRGCKPQHKTGFYPDATAEAR